MSLNILPARTDAFHLTPVEPRHAPLFCLALLTVSCALGSFAFACTAPFAAFAVVAAAMLPMRPALLTVTGAWLVNQAIGFGALHYPIDADTMLWGCMIGASSLVATMVSAAVLRVAGRSHTLLVLALALVGAFSAYELTMFAATPFLGGAETFSAGIVAHLGLLSASWLIGLVAVCEIVRLLNPVRRGQAVS